MKPRVPLGSPRGAGHAGPTGGATPRPPGEGEAAGAAGRGAKGPPVDRSPRKATPLGGFQQKAPPSARAGIVASVPLPARAARPKPPAAMQATVQGGPLRFRDLPAAARPTAVGAVAEPELASASESMLARAAAPLGEPTKGMTVAARYRLERLIARGGMGSVWAATDDRLERPVAIKFMDSRLAADRALRERFQREAKAAAKLRTPHVVEIFEHGIDGERPFIAMELLEGEDLQARLLRDKRLALPEAARVVAQVAMALEAAAAEGIVHRDLKPANVFLAMRNGEVVVKVLDFGVAKMLGASLEEATKAGFMLGSPQYMSPEQARSLAVDHRSDIWSLAAITFRVITGKQAFPGKSEIDVAIKVCVAPVPVPSEVLPSLPPEIDRFFEKALKRKVDERFQSALELSQAFADAIREATGESVLAPPGPRPVALPPPEPALEEEAPIRRAPAPEPKEVATAHVSAVAVPAVNAAPEPTAPIDAPPPTAQPGWRRLTMLAGAVVVGLLVGGLLYALLRF